ncbi:MAG: GTP 3',8-cyclase MoaA [Fidelibacterota bacterium]
MEPESILKKRKTAVPAEGVSPSDGQGLVDTFGRIFNYARIAVNERCNLRCVYCMPEQGVAFRPERKLLTAEEITRVIQILAGVGVEKIRFTGGEPLLRRDIVDLVALASGTPGIQTVSLTTNGLLFRRKGPSLFQAGLAAVNISLDTLDPDRFVAITRRPGLESVLEGLDVALELPISKVKLNMVVMRDFNHMELGEFVELTRDRPLTVRFIELMPFDAHQIWKTGKFLGAERIVEELKALYPDLEALSGSATETYRFTVPGFQGKIGVIPSFTRSLCGDCDRIRITADGKIRNCLYSDNEFNVRDLMRGGGSDEEVTHLFRKAMWAKVSDGWEAQRQGDHHRESMTQIGG